MTNGHDGGAYRRLATQVRTTGDTCWLCGRPIDRELPPDHPAAPSADHVVALARGGEPHGEMRPAHLICNLRRGDRDPALVDFDRPLQWDSSTRNPTPKHSRDWG